MSCPPSPDISRIARCTSSIQNNEQLTSPLPICLSQAQCNALQTDFQTCSTPLQGLIDDSITLKTCSEFLVSVGLANTAVADRFCVRPTNQLVDNLCGACPDPKDLPLFKTLEKCFVTEPGALDDAARASYDVYNCLSNNNQVEPPICGSPSSDFRDFDRCELSVSQVVRHISSETTTCEDVLAGETLGRYCSLPYNQARSAVCTVCTDFKCRELLPGITGLSFLIIGIVLLLLLCAGGFGARHYRRKNRKRSSRVRGSQMSSQVPDLLTQSARFAKTNSLKHSLTHSSFSRQSRLSSAFDSYTDEYLATSQFDNLEPPSVLEAQLLKASLVEFYKTHTPEKAHIEDMVDDLMHRYRLDKLARAIKAKYGAIPAAWDSLLLPRELVSTPSASSIKYPKKAPPPEPADDEYEASSEANV